MSLLFCERVDGDDDLVGETLMMMILWEGFFGVP
jgi:hypothetical protein